MLERLAFLEGLLEHRGNDARVGEQAHEVILKGDEEAGTAGVALTGATATELAVDAADFMAFGRDDVEPAEFADAFA